MSLLKQACARIRRTALADVSDDEDNGYKFNRAIDSVISIKQSFQHIPFANLDCYLKGYCLPPILFFVPHSCTSARKMFWEEMLSNVCSFVKRRKCLRNISSETTIRLSTWKRRLKMSQTLWSSTMEVSLEKKNSAWSLKALSVHEMWKG